MAIELGNRRRDCAASVKVAWTQAAIRDLVHIRAHIGRDDPDAATLTAGRILRAMDRLPKHPEVGRIGRLAGTRELVVTGTPYFVPYRIQAKVIQLLRVIHGRQDWPGRSGRASRRIQPTRKKTRAADT